MDPSMHFDVPNVTIMVTLNVPMSVKAKLKIGFFTALLEFCGKYFCIQMPLFREFYILKVQNAFKSKVQN